MRISSLKTKMGLNVLGLMTLLTLVMALCAFSYFEAAFKKSLSEQEFLLVENIAREIENKLDSAQSALVETSKKVYPDMLKDPDKAQAFLNSKTGLITLFDNHIFLFSVSGKIIAEAPYQFDRRGMDFSHREYIQMTLKTGRPYIGSPYVSSQEHHHPAVMLTAPVYNKDGEMIAIMAGGLDLMKDNFLGALPYTRIGKGGYLYMYNTDRTIIIHPDSERIMKQDVPLGANELFDKAIEGFEGTEETVNSREVPMLATFKGIKNTKWILAANHPSEEAYAAVIQAKKYLMVAVPLGMLLLILAVWYVMRTMTRPLELLTQHVERLSDKQGEERFSSFTPNDEIGALSIAFNKMLLELDKKTDSLKKSEELYRIQNKHLTSLHEISLGLMNRLDINDLLATIILRAGELVGTPHGCLYLLNTSSDAFEQKVGLGLYKQHSGFKVKSGEGMVSMVKASGKPVIIEDYSSWSGGIQELPFKKIRAVLHVPLTSESKVIGIIGLAFVEKNRNFGEPEVQMLSRFAEMASIALDNARLYTAAQQEITERKRAQEALRQVKDGLEAMVEERTQDLSALNEELTAMNEELTAMNQELFSTNEELYNEVAERQRVEQELTKAIDHLKNMQTHLIQSEKMAALGSLVAGVAHEINTPIGVSVTASSHLKQVTEQFIDLCQYGKPLRKDLYNYLDNLREASNIILKNLERAGKLIQSFKRVSVDQSNEAQRIFGIGKYLEEILLSMNPQIKKTKHHITIECDAELNLNGFPGAFAQIVTNLVMNSLTHAYDIEDEGNIRITVRKEDKYIVFVYSDDGRGMESNVLARIFDPFFTTKRGTGGTGLGLYIVYNIVTQQFGGNIECDSVPGMGTIFRIYLPIREGSVQDGTIR